MTLKTLMAATIAAAFAFPVYAGGDKASSGSSASGGATKSDGGAEAMFKALDKNKDGSLTREEAKGTPHDKDFDTLDKNKDGKLTRQEHAAAPEHQADKSSSSGSTSSTGTSKRSY